MELAAGDRLPEMPTSRLSVVNDPSENRINCHISNITTPGKKESNSRARVLFTYSPKHEDELALREVGQIIEIVSKSNEDPGWLLAEVDGRQGLIPDNFVEILRPTVSTSTINSDTQKVSFKFFFFFGEVEEEEKRRRQRNEVKGILVD
ncbi:unnamed protein product [Onchocerca flexuosa]|uniref:SH3 domain-containing protein n=1 Tax=Onchocerca flexuosa TaxID=387005 RepID=A0A183HI13_9BILA|nr:unnamed protein product [Onchocerca flexuosa]